MKRPNRPERRKVDPLLSPDMRREEAACHSAIAPLDRLAKKMDQKWGVDRLVEIVSPETAAKYGSVMGRLNDGIRTCDVAVCTEAAQTAMRGLAAMDKEATAAGAERPEVVAEYEIDGFHFAIIGDAGHWKPICEDRPNLRVYSLREIGALLKQLEGTPVAAVKDVFKGAQITTGKLTNDFFEKGGDEIPW